MYITQSDLDAFGQEMPGHRNLEALYVRVENFVGDVLETFVDFLAKKNGNRREYGRIEDDVADRESAVVVAQFLEVEVRRQIAGQQLSADITDEPPERPGNNFHSLNLLTEIFRISILCILYSYNNYFNYIYISVRISIDTGICVHNRNCCRCRIRLV